eukprot:COSAG06_NODE_49977_length_321_cov_4.792793_1_plen_26_part_10
MRPLALLTISHITEPRKVPMQCLLDS